MAATLVALVAASCSLQPTATPAFRLKPAAPRAAIFAAASTTLDLTDSDGDKISFRVAEGDLQMLVGEELLCDSVETLEYGTRDGQVRQDYGVGNFQLMQGPEREAQAAALRELATEAGVEWLQFDELPELPPVDTMASVLAAAEGIVLPPEVAAMLDVDDELRESEPAARVLWSRLLEIYPSEDAALAAVRRNSALIMPYMNKPAFIDGSWRVLNQMMSEAEALEVVTKNPGILACNPAGLVTSDAETVKRAAGFVDGVESTLDNTVRKWMGWKKE